MPGPVARTDHGRPPGVGRWRGAAGRQLARLDEPLSPTRCVLGWLAATGLFLVSVGIWYSVGGTPGDAAESSVPAVAVAHGTLRCAYPPELNSSVPPVYPLVAGGVMAATGIGRTGLPAAWQAGIDCHQGMPVRRLLHSALRPVLAIGLLGWPVLLAGFVLLVRAAGKGRSRREVAGALLLACAPPVAAPVAEFFHPEDLFAMGLVLASVATAVRGKWLVAGALIGLACCSKQFAVLAAVPLFVAAPGRRRWGLLAVALAVGALVLVPLGTVMGRGMVVASLGSRATPTGNRTLVALLDLEGAARLAVSRALPIVLAAATAVWAQVRLKGRLGEAVPLVAAVAASLSLRMVFEVNIYGYYFMAMAVSLVAVDVVAGRFRRGTVWWIVAVSVFYPPADEPFVLVRDRFPVAVQLAVALSGLCLAAAPLVRACTEDRPAGRGPEDGAVWTPSRAR